MGDWPFIVDNHVRLFCSGISGEGRWKAFHRMRILRNFIGDYLQAHPETPADGTWPLDLWSDKEDRIINPGLMFLEYIEPDFMAAVAILDRSIEAWLWETKAQPKTI